MPRIYTSQSDPIDFCIKHFPRTEALAFELYGHLGDGPDGRGNCFSYDDDHPDYYEDDMYHCEVCDCQLGDQDAYWDGSIEQAKFKMGITSGHWAIHHLDGNPNNNDLSNLRAANLDRHG